MKSFLHPKIEYVVVWEGEVDGLGFGGNVFSALIGQASVGFGLGFLCFSSFEEEGDFVRVLFT